MMAEVTKLDSGSENDAVSQGISVTTENLIEGGKNSKTVFCQCCPSKILRPHLGIYNEMQFFMPHVKKKPNLDDPKDGELLTQFWAVDDIYTFENMGFSNTVGTTKYLVCADCENGPLGWQDLQTKMSYVALQRVLHK